MSESQKRAKKKHELKRDVKRVSFNLETETELLKFANSVDFSKWVKSAIKQHLQL